MAEKKNPDRPLPYQMSPGLRARLEAVRGDKTLTGLLNDVLTTWIDDKERGVAGMGYLTK